MLLSTFLRHLPLKVKDCCKKATTDILTFSLPDTSDAALRISCYAGFCNQDALISMTCSSLRLGYKYLSFQIVRSPHTFSHQSALFSLRIPKESGLTQDGLLKIRQAAGRVLVLGIQNYLS